MEYLEWKFDQNFEARLHFEAPNYINNESNSLKVSFEEYILWNV